MSNTAEQFENKGNPSIDGMEEIFDEVTSSETLGLPTEVEEVTEDNYELLSIAEASRIKGVPYTTFYKQVKAGKHPTETDSDGKLWVKVSNIEEVTSNVTHTENGVTSGDSSVTNDVTSVSPGETIGENPVIQTKHLDLIQDLNEKLTAASYRIGYLESQVREREQDIKELKLITDTQNKPEPIEPKLTKWERFKKWFIGG